MFSVKEENDAVSMQFSSDMALADRAVREVTTFMQQHGEESISDFKLVLRELLINAIGHGNRSIQQRRVICEITRLAPHRYRMDIEDEGQGFDDAAIDYTVPDDPRQLRHRGFSLINAFSDTISFNDKGNRVSVTISLPVEVMFSISDENGIQVICPSGGITATAADKFRVLLLELVKAGHRNYRFDMSHVDAIDSVSLSVFVVFAKMLARQGDQWNVEIINASDSMRKLFRITRIDKALKLSVPEGSRNGLR